MRHKTIGAILIVLCLFLFLVWLIPAPRFTDPFSTIITDNEDRILSANIATDGQWRFPNIETLPEKYKIALLTYEDKYFFYHPGLNIVSIGRATLKNIKAGKVVQGGSTISMQVARLSRKGKQRNWLQKIIESGLVLKLELTHSKEEILRMYAYNAPFGGNIVGLETACQKYFGRKPDELSWAEAAMLAVLPNSPSLIFPGKNKILLVSKRNTLLKRLYENETINKTTYYLALEEPIPEKALELPDQAPHLLTRAVNDGLRGTSVKTTIDNTVQKRTQELLQRYYTFLKPNGIHNGAILVLDVNTGKALAYVSTLMAEESQNGAHVDMIHAKRSYGSLLKPFLYAAMLHEGTLLPHMVVDDIPTYIAGFSPKNYFKDYDGIVPANEVLSRSLNVPSVRMLQAFGIEKFHTLLPAIGITTIDKNASHYGLSIILGGGEATLWEMTGAYASFARSVKTGALDFYEPYYHLSDSNRRVQKSKPELDIASIYFALDAISESNRPGSDGSWHLYSSSQKIAWKTGTSYGLRDAWAIGVTPKYAVGVWLGNADNEGRAGLTGIGLAAPVMFDVFSFLEKSQWFKAPAKGIIQENVCAESGYRASRNCEHVKSEKIPEQGIRSHSCPFHLVIHLDKTERFRVDASCEKVDHIIHKKWFVLPPVQEMYFKNKNSFYRELPAFRAGCNSANNAQNIMQLIYPRKNTKIYLPINMDGKKGKSVFKLAHKDKNKKVYWHIDNEYVGETKTFHELEIVVGQGIHSLNLVDENGEMCKAQFEVISK